VRGGRVRGAVLVVLVLVLVVLVLVVLVVLVVQERRGNTTYRGDRQCMGSSLAGGCFAGLCMCSSLRTVQVLLGASPWTSGTSSRSASRTNRAGRRRRGPRSTPTTSRTHAAT